MKERHQRFLCAVCALIVWVSAVFPPAAFAVQAGDEPLAAVQSLTAEDAARMQQADQAVTALTESEAYNQMDVAARCQAALEMLDSLAEQRLIVGRSVSVDEANGIISFAYPCGVWGGVLLQDPAGVLDAENELQAQLPPDLGQQSLYSTTSLYQAENRHTDSFSNAVIYYAFDNTVNSSRYPYYTYMKGFWSAMGLDTRLDTTVTISDLKKMDDYDVCVLSAHGAYYTYTTGWLWKKTHTEPIILLTERSSVGRDLRYGMDLLRHRIIKVNGMYCITSDFFRGSYRRGQLRDTIVYSETCEFLGVDPTPDTSMADALLAGGAKAVVGYVNNVYTVYSRSMLWDIVNHLAVGQSVGEALGHAKDTYGADDLVWYRAQGGRSPHAAASYAVLYGDSGARLEVSASAARNDLLEPAA